MSQKLLAPAVIDQLIIFNFMQYKKSDTDNKSDPLSAAEQALAGTRSTWVSAVINVALSITQIAVGIFAKLQGLIADGVHSLSDLIADFVVLFASHHSKKDADDDHPYGHQRFETAASLALGILLLVVGIGMLWSAFHKLEAPESIQKVHVTALWVAGIALISKELLFRYMLAVANRVKSSMLMANAWRARSDDTWGYSTMPNRCPLGLATWGQKYTNSDQHRLWLSL